MESELSFWEFLFEIAHAYVGSNLYLGKEKTKVFLCILFLIIVSSYKSAL